MPHNNRSNVTRRTVLGTLAAWPFMHFAQSAHAGAWRVSKNKDGIAMQGYDSHAYWTIAAPRAGSASHTVQWRGTPWHFATAADAAAFKANPAAYEPQFGGFCTRAMSFNKVVNGDPEVWRIYQDKLYLFAAPMGGTKFDAGQDAMIAKAQTNWDKRG